jgi:hypothetical protein
MDGIHAVSGKFGLASNRTVQTDDRYSLFDFNGLLNGAP